MRPPVKPTDITIKIIYTTAVELCVDFSDPPRPSYCDVLSEICISQSIFDVLGLLFTANEGFECGYFQQKLLNEIQARKFIDGCSIALCSDTVSEVSAGICHRNRKKFNCMTLS